MTKQILEENQAKQENETTPIGAESTKNTLPMASMLGINASCEESTITMNLPEDFIIKVAATKSKTGELNTLLNTGADIYVVKNDSLEAPGYSGRAI